MYNNTKASPVASGSALQNPSMIEQDSCSGELSGFSFKLEKKEPGKLAFLFPTQKYRVYETPHVIVRVLDSCPSTQQELRLIKQFMYLVQTNAMDMGRNKILGKHYHSDHLEFSISVHAKLKCDLQSDMNQFYDQLMSELTNGNPATGN